LLQGNKENQKIVEELNATGVVPSEILDRHGYEPFIDEKGRVKLKRTDVELESENGGSQGY
jgi:palmitoyltransferase